MNNNSKTEFLFESEEDKIIIKKAEKELKEKNNYKKIRNRIFIVLLLISILTVGLKYFEYLEVSKIKAQIIKPAKKLPSETLSKYKPAVINQDYNNKYTVLVNENNIMDIDYISKYRIVNIKDNLYNNISLEKETYENYLKLKENLLERGYFINIKSGYYKYNIEITSEHNIGLGFDIIINSKENSYESNYNGSEYNYLSNTACLYGFIIRYPKDKEKITGYKYNPEHLRYVGVELAKYLTKNNLTLEEYYE